MRIVVDAMGSDSFPKPDVEGSVLAAQESGDTIILVGDRARIEPELAKYAISALSIEVVHAPSAVDMHDRPSQVTRTKRDSSMAIGMELVRDGKAEAFVTAGNTGAALAFATLGTLRRIEGVKRPALATVIKLGDKMVILTDLGANADARADWLLQFGVMGSVYAEKVFGIANPRVALLSNGEEEGKGSALVKDSAALFAASRLNFIGNVEPKEMIAGAADVVVADGFVGNIALKSMEAVADQLFNLIRDNFKSAGLTVKLGAILARPALRQVYRQIDPFEVGGAPLLGVNGVVIIGHGRTNAKGIKNAIRQAHNAAQSGVIDAIRDGIARYETAEPTPASGEPSRQ
jgi:glycerol-3-phosphate acyltransferase PlsX